MNVPRPISFLIPKLQDLLFLVIFAFVILLGPKMLNADGDLPRHILVGRVILERGAPPEMEIFSYVYENQPYALHEWLTAVAFYLIYSASGLSGIVLLAAALIASAFMVVYIYAASLRGGKIALFFLILWSAWASSVHWITRPHLVTMLFLAVWLVFVDRVHRGQDVKIWILPAIMLLWSNMHFEFIAGFLVLLAYIAGWTWEYLMGGEDANIHSGKKLALAAGLSFCASLINPIGPRIWLVVFQYVNNPYLMSRVGEMRPPDFTQPRFQVLLVLIAFSIFVLACARNRTSYAKGFLLAGFTMLSLSAGRNVHMYGVVAPFALAEPMSEIFGFRFFRQLESAIARMEDQLRGFVWPVVITVGCAALFAVSSFGQSNQFASPFFPVDAVRWLKENPQNGRMFNNFNWGGYILLHLWPGQMVFIDSQTDTTGDVTQKYETVITLADGWESILDEYNVAWALIPANSALAGALIDKGWSEIYRDDAAVIIRR